MTLEEHIIMVAKDKKVFRVGEDNRKCFEVIAGAIFVAPTQIMPLRQFYRI